MPAHGTQRWASLERMSPTFFLLAAGFFLVNAAIVVSGISTGAERMTTLLGETFNAAGSVFALLGLLGFYPSVRSQRPWLSRSGAICATIGVGVFTVLSALSLAFYVRVIEGSIQTLVPLILPGVILGGVVSFLLLGIAVLRTDGYHQTMGLLLLLPPLIVILNIIGGATGLASEYFLLGVVSGLLVVTGVIGLRLRAASSATRRAETTPSRTVE